MDTDKTCTSLECTCFYHHPIIRNADGRKGCTTGMEEVPRGIFYAPSGDIGLEEIVIPDSVKWVFIFGGMLIVVRPVQSPKAPTSRNFSVDGSFTEVKLLL